MGEIRASIEPVLLFVAGFAQEEEPLLWSREYLAEKYGPIELESETFRFDAFTRYYEREMGATLFKRIWAFRDPIDPGELAEIKIATNALESDAVDIFARKESVQRPLNLDPGYVDLGKLVLASTKDFSHRIYLQNGIFAEITLIYTKKNWQSLPWTYADYQSEGYQEFFTRCRKYLSDKGKGKRECEL